MVSHHLKNLIADDNFKKSLLEAIKHILLWKNDQWDSKSYDTAMNELISRLTNICNKYNIIPNNVLRGGNIALVIEGSMDGDKVIVKINPYGENSREIEYLYFLQSVETVINLIEVEDQGNTFIMPKFGNSLASNTDMPIEDKLYAIGTTVKNFQEPILEIETLPIEMHISTQLKTIKPDNKTFSDILEKYSRLTKNCRFLHYDIQDHNILHYQGEYKLIDPIGRIGNKHFENYALLSASDGLIMKPFGRNELSNEDIINYIQIYSQAANFNYSQLLETLYIRTILNLKKIKESPPKTFYSQHRLEWEKGLKRLEKLLETELSI